MGSLVGGANQYIQLVCHGLCTVNCRPSVRQLPTFPHKFRGFEPPNSDVGGQCATTAPDWSLSNSKFKLDVFITGSIARVIFWGSSAFCQLWGLEPTHTERGQPVIRCHKTH